MIALPQWVVAALTTITELARVGQAHSAGFGGAGFSHTEPFGKQIKRGSYGA